jgi:hypothetical protein
VEIWLKTVDFLSHEECAVVHSWVHERRRYWKQRHPVLSFYTLGAASHLDAVNNGAKHYRDLAAEENERLWNGLEWVYNRLAESLSRELGEAFFYDKTLGLPGFHIFLDPALSCSGSAKHFDLEHELIDWDSYELVDEAKKLSLTLAIRVPASGAGLWVWDINYLDLQELSPAAVRVLCERNARGTLHPYTPGRLVVHSGYQLHQIGTSPQFQPNQERLTLQAHAQRVREGYVLYW